VADYRRVPSGIRRRLASYSALSRPCGTEYGASAIHHGCYTRNGLIQGVCIAWNSKLKRVSLKEIWGDKARNFTPRLATDEALGLLSEVFGRGLEPIGTEVAVGPYSADILEIISQPKRGTTIHARVPLNSGGNSMCATG
jgi:hypothetical protein